MLRAPCCRLAIRCGCLATRWKGRSNRFADSTLTGLRSNTGAIVPKQDASQGIKHFKFLADETGKRPRQLVPFAADEDPAVNRVWAIHGVVVESKVFLFYHRISLLKNVDVFVNFQLDGMGIAKADVGNLAFARLTAPDGSRLFWKTQEPTFGVWVMREDEYIYVWGCLMTGMYLARTRPGTIADLASYEYLVESPTAARPDVRPKWDAKFSPVGALFDSVPNEMSVSFNCAFEKVCGVSFVAAREQNRDAYFGQADWSVERAGGCVPAGADWR